MDQDSPTQNFCTEVFVWGNNKNYQCGVDQDDIIQFPMKIYVPIVVRQAVCGQSHTVLSTNEGQIYCFGSNLYGQLGIGFNQNLQKFESPQLVQTLQNTNCTKIAAGQNHTLSLSDEGIAYGWGQSENGQLGHPQDCVYEPIQLTENHRFISLLAGQSFSLFVKENDGIYLCGKNFIDVPNTEQLKFFPLDIEFQVQEICTGSECILILTTTNELYVIISEIERIKLPITNIQSLYSGYNPLICLEDNSLYQYLCGKLTQLDTSQCTGIVECSQGMEISLIIDENNQAHQFKNGQLQQIRELQNQDIRIVSAGYDHYVAIGQITKQNKQFKLNLSPCDNLKNNKIIQSNLSFGPIKENLKLTHQYQVNMPSLLQEFVEDKACQTELDHTKQLQSQIKQLEAELLTLAEEGSNLKQVQKENSQLKRQNANQQKNLEFQLQYQQTLQEQIQRLISENEKQKSRLSPPQQSSKKQQIVQEIHAKQANLRCLIQSFYNDHHRAMALIRQYQY